MFITQRTEDFQSSRLMDLMHSESMEKELNRLATFGNFPTDSPVHPVRLAEAGFFYDGHQDEVRCFQCNIKHKNWMSTDDPFQKHLLLSSSCVFIKHHPKVQSDDNNCERKIGTFSQEQKKEKYLNGTTSSAACEANGGYNNICEDTETEKNVKVGSNNANKNINASCVNTTNLTKALLCSQPSPTLCDLHKTAVASGNDQGTEPLGVTTARPKYPSLSVQSVRYASYKNWPSYLKQTPEELSKAGFFYEGHEDNVRCFFCAGGLKEWEPEDDPWFEHARWFPRCVFLRQCKGDQFVNDVQSGIVNAIKNAQPESNDNNSKKSSVANNTACHGGFSMDDPAVLSVIEMGYTSDVVKKAMAFVKKGEEQKQKTSAEILLQAVWDMEDSRDSGNESDTSNNEKKSDIEDGISHENNRNERKFTSQETKTLLTENQNLKEMRRCKICLDEEASIVFLPCGHLVSCASCAPALLKCPICRTYVKGTVKVIIS